MPDISKCHGTDCPNRDQCHRFTATPSAQQQSYFAQSPITTEDIPRAAYGFCGYFMPNDVWLKKAEAVLTGG